MENPSEYQNFINEFLTEYTKKNKTPPKELGKLFIGFGTAMIVLGKTLVSKNK